MSVVDPEPTESTDPNPAGSDARWQAYLRLRLARTGDRTTIVERSERGRLSIEGPRYADADDPCYVAVSYPPSGIASGERSRLKIDVTDAGQAVLTTSSPVRVRRSPGPITSVDRQLTVSNTASLEWLPRAIAVGRQSVAQANTRVILEEDARFLGWELVALGWTADGAIVERGRLEQRLEVRRAGATIVDERIVVDGASIRGSTGATGGRAFGTLVAVSPGGVSESIADAVLRSQARSPLPGSVWLSSGVLTVRIPAAEAAEATERLGAIRAQLSETIFGRPAAPGPFPDGGDA